MATRLIALFLLAGSLLPFANLVPGGAVDPAYADRLQDWMYGLALCIGVGVLAAYIVRVRRRTMAGRGGGLQSDAVTSEAPTSTDATDGIVSAALDGWFIALVSLGAFALYVAISRFVFSGRPLLIDEIVQVMQARWYAAGRLWMPIGEYPEFFSILHVVDVDGRVFGQFPAGGPAMLALGSLVGAEWLVGPVAGALCVALFARLLPHLEPGASRRWYRGTTLLFAVAPFGAFMFGSHMNHATTLLWLLVATLGLSRATASLHASAWWGLAAGCALGIAATIRPLDGAAFALPAAAWLAWRARHGGRPFRTLMCSGVGVAIPLAILFWVNTQTTGDPFTFGYDQLWGAGHALGFHDSAWGPAHTPQRGLELVSLYLTRLSTYLFETPFPALLLVAGGLWLTRSRRLSPLDRYLLATAGLTIVGYWAYWHDGFFLGPRFFFPLLPALVLWAARFPLRLRAKLGVDSVAWAGVRAALVAGAMLSVVDLAAVRIPSYRSGLTSMRFDIERESARAGVRDALVLVKESWGTRLIVRMWALGVPHGMAERLYRFTDACQLELAIRGLEGTTIAGKAAEARLVALLADSARVIPSTISPETTEGLLPGFPYAPACRTEVARDWDGYSHLAPFLLAKDGNVYARWIPGREAEIVAAYPGRRPYLLVRRGEVVTWEPLDPDRVQVRP